MRDENDFLDRRIACQLGQERAEIALVPIHVGFIDRIFGQRALRRPAILDDGAIETGEPCDLHSGFGVAQIAFAETVYIDQNAPAFGFGGIAESAPPRSSFLKLSRHTAFGFALGVCRFDGLAEAGVAHGRAAVLEKLDRFAAAIGQARGDEEELPVAARCAAHIAARRANGIIGMGDVAITNASAARKRNQRRKCGQKSNADHSPRLGRCSLFTQRTVPLDARITTVSVVTRPSRKVLTPSSNDPSVTPVAAKMQSPLASSSRS